MNEVSGEVVSRANALLDIIDTIAGDLGPAGHDGWTQGYVHATDLDLLQQAVTELRAALSPASFGGSREV